MLIFIDNNDLLKLLKEKSNSEENISLIISLFTFHILQPTGGFTEILSPDLEFMEDEYEQMEINIQHTESQIIFVTYGVVCFVIYIYEVK